MDLEISCLLWLLFDGFNVGYKYFYYKCLVIIQDLLERLSFFITGVCYDAVNDVIWCCVNDSIDQFINPANLAMDNIHQRIGDSSNLQDKRSKCECILISFNHFIFQNGKLKMNNIQE